MNGSVPFPGANRVPFAGRGGSCCPSLAASWAPDAAPCGAAEWAPGRGSCARRAAAGGTGPSPRDAAPSPRPEAKSPFLPWLLWLLPRNPSPNARRSLSGLSNDPPGAPRARRPGPSPPSLRASQVEAGSGGGEPPRAQCGPARLRARTVGAWEGLKSERAHHPRLLRAMLCFKRPGSLAFPPFCTSIVLLPGAPETWPKMPWAATAVRASGLPS